MNYNFETPVISERFSAHYSFPCRKSKVLVALVQHIFRKDLERFFFKLSGHLWNSCFINLNINFPSNRIKMQSFCTKPKPLFCKSFSQTLPATLPATLYMNNSESVAINSESVAILVFFFQWLSELPSFNLVAARNRNIQGSCNLIIR